MTTLTITVDSCSERMCLRYQNRIGGTSRVRRATNTPVPGTRRTSPLAIWETRSSTGSCISSASSCTAAVPSAKPASARQAVATPPPASFVILADRKPPSIVANPNPIPITAGSGHSQISRMATDRTEAARKWLCPNLVLSGPSR
jgi:hypothetical protein